MVDYCPKSVHLERAEIVKNKIRPPVKIDAEGRIIRNPKIRAHSWRLNIPPSITGTKKERKFFATESEAKEYAEGLLRVRHDAGNDIMHRLRERGMSVTDALEYALRHAPKKQACRLSKACEAYIDSRKASNCKERYLENLKSQMKLIVEELGDGMMDTFDKSMLDRFLKNLTGKDGDTPAKAKSKINYIITLQALFNFAVEEGWRGESPAAKIRRPARDEVVTCILSVDEVERLLRVGGKPAHSEVFPALLIQLFGGPRRSELPHVEWGVIRDNYLRLDKTKIRKKRAVEISDTLLCWLAPFRGRKGRVFAPDELDFNEHNTLNIEDAYTARLDKLAAEANVDLPRNVLRHTAITYRLALTGDIARTADWAGNSIAVIEEHYRGAATMDDARNFYALFPDKSAASSL